MAELGQGVALARSSVVENLLKSGHLIAPFSHRIEASESFYLVREQAEELSTDAATFSTWLVGQAHRLL
jgi:LysR family glycine cleavage system transcriptional activator